MAACTPIKSCRTDAGFQSDLVSMITVSPLWMPQFGVWSIWTDFMKPFPPGLPDGLFSNQKSQFV
jgi:hypothetical protein